MMQTIATHSFKGGSGKSFVALNIAATFARKGLKTVIMDCDFASPSIQTNLPSNGTPKKFGNDFLLGESNIEDIITPTLMPNFDAIHADPEPRMGQGILNSSENVHWKALQQISLLRETLEEKGYKKFILDTTSDFSYTSASALMIADSIVIVHRPVLHTLKITIHVLQTVYAALKKSLKRRQFYIIYNQVPHGTSDDVQELLNSLTNEFQKHIDLTVLGYIPIDPNMDFCKTLLLNDESTILKNLEVMVAKMC